MNVEIVFSFIERRWNVRESLHNKDLISTVDPLKLFLDHFRFWQNPKTVKNKSLFSREVQLKRSLLCRHSLGSSRNLPPPRTSTEAKGTSLIFCLLASRPQLRTLPQRSPGDHVEITLEPISADLLWNKKVIINWTDSSQRRRFQSKTFKSSLRSKICEFFILFTAK